MIEGPALKPTGRKSVQGRVQGHIETNKMHLSDATDPHHGRKWRRPIHRQDQIQIGRMGEGWREESKASSVRPSSARPIGALKPSTVQQGKRYSCREEFDTRYEQSSSVGTSNDILSGARDGQHRNSRRHIPSEPSETSRGVGLMTTFGHGRQAWQEHERRRHATPPSVEDDLHQRPFVRRQVPSTSLAPASPPSSSSRPAEPTAGCITFAGPHQSRTTIGLEQAPPSPARRRVNHVEPPSEEAPRRIPMATPVSPHPTATPTAIADWGKEGAAGGGQTGRVGGKGRGQHGGEASVSARLWTSEDAWEGHHPGRRQFSTNRARPATAVGAAGVPWALG